jgi:hypothetical protein
MNRRATVLLRPARQLAKHMLGALSIVGDELEAAGSVYRRLAKARVLQIAAK